MPKAIVKRLLLCDVSSTSKASFKSKRVGILFVVCCRKVVTIQFEINIIFFKFN